NSVSGELFHHEPAFLLRLEFGVSHKLDWKATVVLAPTGALVTAATPGGLNMGEAVRASIHCATGSKCAELGNVPETPRATEPMDPAGAGPLALTPVEAVAATGAPVVAELVPVKVVIPRPAGIRCPSWVTTADQSTARAESCETSPWATRSSLVMATTLSYLGIWALRSATLAVSVVTPSCALWTCRKRPALAATRTRATTPAATKVLRATLRSKARCVTSGGTRLNLRTDSFGSGRAKPMGVARTGSMLAACSGSRSILEGAKGASGDT